VKRDEKPIFFQRMTDRLRSGGYLVNAEISFDLDSAEFPLMLKNWESVQKLMGGTPESLANLPKQLRDVLAVVPPLETEDLIRQSGIAFPVRFFQALMICAWYGRKEPLPSLVEASF
jgi:tRNA (cmo5U34)-methyltransferase